MTDSELIDRLLFLAQTAVDQALDCNYDDPEDYFIYRELRNCCAARRRPKPPSLKQQALALIDGCNDPDNDYLDDDALVLIRRALEQLPDNE